MDYGLRKLAMDERVKGWKITEKKAFETAGHRSIYFDTVNGHILSPM